MNNTKLSESDGSANKVVKVKIERGNVQRKEYFFSGSFTIGRSDECSIQIDEGVVSRIHLEINFETDKWWINDKQSSNGTFLNGNKVDHIELKNTISLELGSNGPILLFSLVESEVTEKQPEPQPNDPSVTKYIKHYFDESADESQIGDHTRMMRQAFKVVKKKHTSKYLKLIIAIGVIAVIAGAYAIYLNVKENKQRELAENVFYNMKELELEIAALKDVLQESDDPKIREALARIDAKRQELENNYNKIVDDLGIYDLKEEDKIITRVARVLGESELTMPKDFTDEVKKYIKKWQSSDRLVKALDRAQSRGFNQVVVNYLTMNQLPVQYFYLALQESDFREQIVGPQTRYGYAKGIWQFIPQTGQRYGLKIGPLVSQNIYDPGDERFNFPKATSAAARYIKDIYKTDAQASGLLVMASYNWGEGNIIRLLRRMPENPRDRNFWNLLKNYRDKLPDETYNYVFYIFSAAVIGENPKLFGFDFENPLQEAIYSLENM
ncbi:MAG: FHA domain-containing protein [Ignavibacteriaceae bacterium]